MKSLMQNAEKGLVCGKETHIGLLVKKSYGETGRVAENLPLLKCHAKHMQMVQTYMVSKTVEYFFYKQNICWNKYVVIV